MFAQLALAPLVVWGIPLAVGLGLAAAGCSLNTTCQRGMAQFWDGVLPSPGAAARGAGIVWEGMRRYVGDTFASEGMANYTGDSGLQLESSRQLGNNLRSAGQAGFAGGEAHHLVAENDRRAAGARSILAGFGIGIDDAANGVWLSGPGAAAPPGFPNALEHRSLNTRTYNAEVAQRLAGAGNPRQAVAILGQIRQEILAGTFPR